MPIIIRNGFRFANSLAVSACINGVRGCFAAVFCIVVSLCAAPLASAEPETLQAETVHAEKTQGSEESGADEHNKTRSRISKKKIGIAQFDVANTQHVDDINNIYDGFPLALSSRLEADGEFLTTYTGRSIPAEAGEAQRRAITQIAEEAGVQFLISGMVVNAGISQEKRSLDTPFGWSPKIPFSGYKKRHIEVEFSVYDGLTGNRLLSRRLDEQATGDVMVGNYRPFGSSFFFETEFGKATNRLLDSAVRDIRAALENVPFSAHIIQAEEKRVLLDAGSDSQLKPGDILVAYVMDTGPIAGLKGSMPGVTNRAVDTITLTRVQPQFSVGELSEDAAKLGIRVGNIVRVDPDEQRNLAAKQIAAQQMAKAQQEAKDEAERVKAEQAAQAEAARVKAKQAAKDEANRTKAEKKAQAQAAAEAKAAKLKAKHDARATRGSAAQEARARAQAQAAKLKARQEAQAQKVRTKAEKKAKADTQAAAEAGTQKIAESRVAKTKNEVEAMPKSTKAKKAQKDQPRTEVRAVAEEDLQRAAEAEAGKAEPETAVAKPAASLKLKRVEP